LAVRGARGDRAAGAARAAAGTFRRHCAAGPPPSHAGQDPALHARWARVHRISGSIDVRSPEGVRRLRGGRGGAGLCGVPAGPEESPRELPSRSRASAASAACPSARAAELQRIIEDCEAREVECRAAVRFWEQCWETRRKPVVDQLEALDHAREGAVAELSAEMERIRRRADPLPPGPRCLSWVQSDWFGALCNVVVALNLAGMAFGGEVRAALGGGEVLLDHAYLAWYVAELSVKAAYYQRELLCGPVSVVWWNWMDMLIVVSGVTEQWVIPLLTFTGVPGVKLNLTMLRGLRFLRFLRVLRALKLVRVLVQGDFAWVHGSTYEIIGTVILGVNSLTMAVELDNPDWRCWKSLNSVFLAFYTFDIVCRLKLQGRRFFYDRDTLGWNYLDLVVVTEGVVDQWVVPCVRAVVALLRGRSAVHGGGSSAVGMLKMLRLLRTPDTAAGAPLPEHPAAVQADAGRRRGPGRSPVGHGPDVPGALLGRDRLHDDGDAGSGT
ncbi:unnamed protein product, partial [Prorocentrum cordatum]